MSITSIYRKLKNKSESILFKTALFSWSLVVITIITYVLTLLPYQRSIAIDRMNSEANDIATSIAQVTSTSIISEDYSFAVDHCLSVIKKSNSILYIIIKRHNGFALIHTADGWRQEKLNKGWEPKPEDVQQGKFLVSNITGNEVFQFVYPLSYFGIDWGWIYVGLSLKDFYASLDTMYMRTILAAVLLITIGLILSLYFARKISLPIRKLDQVTQLVAAGNMNAKVKISSGGELQSLAGSFNKMIEALFKAHDELELRVKERTGELAEANRNLQNEVKERERAEEKIQASLKEKVVLLQEIHHRVKNNLQVISSLLYLNSKNINDPATLAMFRESQNRVKTIALIHESLYQSKDLSRIELKEYVVRLTRDLFRTYGVNQEIIKLKIQIENLYLNIDNAIPCGLIINELISNSLKYAFPNNMRGEIIIKADPSLGQECTLIVSDNGIGFPKDIKFNELKSLGIRLVHNLVNQLEGKLEINMDKGAEFIIKFTDKNCKQ